MGHGPASARLFITTSHRGNARREADPLRLRARRTVGGHGFLMGSGVNADYRRADVAGDLACVVSHRRAAGVEMTPANLILLTIIGVLLLSTSANVVSKVDANGNSVSRILCQERADHRSF